MDDSLLYTECMGGNMSAILVLIEKWPHNPEEYYWRRWIYWNRGLWGACYGGHVDIINLMISHGADDFNVGLKYACQGGHINIVQLMISHGANDWCNGFESACRGGHMNIVLFMIEKASEATGLEDIDLNEGLYEACNSEHMDIINFVISQGADNWNRGLQGACWGERINIALLMIEKGASYDYIPKQKIRYYNDCIAKKEMYKNMIDKLDINDCSNIVLSLLDYNYEL